MAGQPPHAGQFFYDPFGFLMVATSSDGFGAKRAIGCQRMLDASSYPTHMHAKFCKCTNCLIEKRNERGS